jgi:SAM-dependent methyltransferase
MKTLKNWTKDFFKADVFHPGDAVHVAAAKHETAFAAKALGLRKGQSVLDLCCGTGRHSLEFARRGYRVFGVDVTRDYVLEAAKLAKGLKNARFAVGDMRKLPFQGEFDAVVNMWTSFGYFLKESDDLRTLKGVARALKPGGKFLVDIIDADWLMKHGLRRNWSRLPGGGYLLEDVVFRTTRDPANTNTWTVLKPGKKPASATFFVRNYNYERMAASLRKAGLRPVKRWGGVDGTPYKKGETKRLVVLAQKPVSPLSPARRLAGTSPKGGRK